MRTVELIPDPAFDTAVRRLWRRLADAGLPSLADHRHPTNRPHLTVAECDALDGDGLDELSDLLGGALPVPVHVGALGMFVHRGVVLHLAVAPSAPLLALHEKVLALVDDRGWQARPQARPGRWVPHVTLAARLPRELVPAALDAVGDALPLAGTWAAGRSYDAVTREVTAL